MAFSMYEASIPVFVRAFNQLSHILAKAEAHASERKIDESIFINARLAADMLPLSKQVQIASDGAKACAARLAGVEVPSFPDTESTFAELQERITKTVAFIESVDKAAVEGSAGKTIMVKLPKQELTFDARNYVQGFVLPNLYFHSTTTYAILRHLGVELGKKDFLGEM